ncbi:MAG TPA: MMPL family transporter [Thermodesulfobacteriota bacterium]|nr:MMPL family transporter [Thermodesulfobacteriota bacterium]
MRVSGRREPRSRSPLVHFLPPLAWCALTFCFLFYVFHYVDLKPKVDEHFFFSSHDPQLRTDQLITKIFLRSPQLIMDAGGDIHSESYLLKLREMTEKLSALAEIDSVQSLTKGPRRSEDAPKSPLWSRVLFSKDQKTSFIYIFVRQDSSEESAVLKIEKIKQRFDSPDFRLIMSGALYIVELIQRSLLHDLKVFTIAAFCVFGVFGLLLSRSLAMVLGTLTACTNASGLALILTHFFGIPIGPLTANLSTIVFVLTLTHMVFMTYNWKHILQDKETSVENAWRKAVRVTLLPSSWSMLTALLGFLSLLSVPATPLRQLGISGAIGTVVAFCAAYIIYPFFLRIQAPRLHSAKAAHEFTGTVFFKNRHGWVVAVILLASAAASIGLWKLDTKPTLFSYFKRGSELRNNFEYIDQNGGSTPLNIVLENPNKAPFKMKEDYPR